MIGLGWERLLFVLYIYTFYVVLRTRLESLDVSSLIYLKLHRSACIYCSCRNSCSC